LYQRDAAGIGFKPVKFVAGKNAIGIYSSYRFFNITTVVQRAVPALAGAAVPCRGFINLQAVAVENDHPELVGIDVYPAGCKKVVAAVVVWSKGIGDEQRTGLPHEYALCGGSGAAVFVGYCQAYRETACLVVAVAKRGQGGCRAIAELPLAAYDGAGRVVGKVHHAVG